MLIRWIVIYPVNSAIHLLNNRGLVDTRRHGLHGAEVLERFSLENRKTKTKVIILTNHDSRKQSNEPIRTRIKYMSPAPSAGKRVRVNHDWFWFYF